MSCLPCFGYKRRFTEAEHRIFSLEATIMIKDNDHEKLKTQFERQQNTLTGARLKLAAQAEELRHLRCTLNKYERPLACTEEIVHNTHRDKPASLQH